MSTYDITFANRKETFGVYIEGGVINPTVSANGRMIVSTGDGSIGFTTLVGGGWTPLQIFKEPGDSISALAVSADGSKLFVANYSGYGYVATYTWNLETLTYDSPVIISQLAGEYVRHTWMGLACTPDGNTLVAYEYWNDGINAGSDAYGGVSFTKWNSTNNSYDPWTQQKLMDVSESGRTISITADGSKIIYGGGINEGGKIYYSMWDNVAQTYGPPNIIAVSGNYSGFSITRDGGIIIVSDRMNIMYTKLNSETNTYGPLTIALLDWGVSMTWLSYDNSTLYYYNDTNQTCQVSVQYFIDGVNQSQTNNDVPSGPTLFLGDDMTITGATVELNNASVSVKTPITGPNVANKDYVDSAVQSTLYTQIYAQTAARIAEDVVLMSQITALQSQKADLSVQLNNLYQYFFSENRDGPVPSRG
jgi:hypothetical protein